MSKSLYQIRKAENKKRFGINIVFNSVRDHSDTGGICAYEDMLKYSNFNVIFDFIDFEQCEQFTNIDDVIREASLNKCKLCKVVAR